MKRIYEILNEVEQAPTQLEKINILRRNRSETLLNVLQGAYHPSIKYVFDSIPTYTEEVNIPPGMGYTSLDVEMKRFYLFVEGNSRVDPNLSFERKKQLLIQLLEALEPKEAKVLANMIMKDLKVKGLDAQVVNEAFPGLIFKG